MSNLIRAEDDKTFQDEVEVRITLPESSICAESESLPLEIYFTNITSQEIKFNEEWLIQRTEFDVVYDPGKRNSRIESLVSGTDRFPGAPLSDLWINLSPGESKRYKTSLELRSRKFFTGPSLYSLEIRCTFFFREPSGVIREVGFNSNEVLFKLTSCPSQADQNKTSLIGHVLASIDGVQESGTSYRYQLFVFGVESIDSQDKVTVAPVLIAYSLPVSGGPLTESFFDYSKRYMLRVSRREKDDVSLGSIALIRYMDSDNKETNPPMKLLKLLDGVPGDILNMDSVLTNYEMF